MLWVTRRHVHMDRVATPWLIRRFIDADAEFAFVPWTGGFQGPSGAIQFAIPGAELGRHDEHGPCFEKVRTKYNVTDPGVVQMSAVVAAGVNFVLHGFRPEPDDRYGQIAVGLVALSDGMMLTHETDTQVLEASMPVYDALHAVFKTDALLRDRQLEPPHLPEFGPGPKTEFLRALLNER
ncbi:MAG TPA: chromate resistance protein ChrB domain-containing protein [Ilumatobacteraceae bacterium]